MINLTKITLLNFFLILLSNNLLANSYNLLSEDVDITISAPFSFQIIDDISQQKIYEKTNNEHLETNDNDEVYHKMWVESEFLDKISEKVFPKLIIIQSNKKNIFTKKQFLSFINNKLENNKFQKIWINGYRIYTQSFNINFEENDYFFENSKDIIKNQLIILLPDYRFATISIFSDKIIPNEDLENFIKISPYFSLKDLAVLIGDENVYGEDGENFENEYTKNTIEFIQTQNYYYKIGDQISLVLSNLYNEMYFIFNDYQNNNIDLTNLRNSFEKTSKILNQEIYKIKNDFKSYKRKDFSNWMDGRYNYILKKFENYIENSFLVFENDLNKFSENIDIVFDDPGTDLSYTLADIYFSSILTDLENTQSMIKLNTNFNVNENSPSLLIPDISFEIYQLHISNYNFLYEVYQYGTDYAPILYIPLLRNNKVSFNNIETSFKLFDRKIIEYEDFIMNILNKLRNNEKVLDISSQMFDSFYSQLNLYEKLFNEYKKLAEIYPLIKDYDDYSNYYDSFMELDTIFSEIIYELSVLQEELRVLGIKYSEEMQKL